MARPLIIMGTKDYVKTWDWSMELKSKMTITAVEEIGLKATLGRYDIMVYSGHPENDIALQQDGIKTQISIEQLTALAVAA